MAGDTERNIQLRFLNKLSANGRTDRMFERSLTNFQAYVASEGLEDEDMRLLANIIIKSATKLSSLIKCLIPRYKVDEQIFKLITNWLLSSIDKLPISVCLVTTQWIIGLWEHQLIDGKVISIYYSVLFFIMLKNEKLQKRIARLIYVLAKPEDVTRRDVNRLLVLCQKYSKQPKHIVVLLSLFKSYKPELVPEKIQSVNVESVWTPIPKPFQLMFQGVKDRLNVQREQDLHSQQFNWNILEVKRKKASGVPLLPSVGYFQIGSNIFKQKDTNSVFDISSIEDLGKLQLNMELPCNAISLLANTAGYHLLTFADLHYQSRFSYNLYNTLMRAFFLETEAFSTEEINKLLDMTIELSRYIQQGVLVVNHFLDEYLNYNTGEYQSKILALVQWMTSISVNDLQEKILVHLQNMFYESSLSTKCEIIKTLKTLIKNLFVNQRFVEYSQKIPTPFFGQGPVDNLEDVISVLTKLSEDFIISGLNIHSYNILFLSEALSFYEEVCALEIQSNILSFTLAPPAVIFGSFVTSSCSILSRMCKLLLRYRDMSLKLKKRKASHLLKKRVRTLSIYVQDIVSALLNDEPFRNRYDAYFLKTIPDNVIEDLRYCSLDCCLNIYHHYAFLPYICVLKKSGLPIKTKEDALLTALYYYPDVNKFLGIF